MLAAAMTACGFSEPPPPSSTKRYGAMTVDRHRALCRQGVYLYFCYFADDTGETFPEGEPFS